MEPQTKSSNKGFLVVFALVTVFLLYWFAIRPSTIRSGCRQESISNSILYVNNGNTWEPDTAKRTAIQEELASALYSACLHEKGLE